jgi:hypothetical protein
MITGLYADLLTFALQLRKPPGSLSKETVDESCPNEFGKIAQHVRKGAEGKKARIMYLDLFVTFSQILPAV